MREHLRHVSGLVWVVEVVLDGYLQLFVLGDIVLQLSLFDFELNLEVSHLRLHHAFFILIGFLYFVDGVVVGVFELDPQLFQLLVLLLLNDVDRVRQLVDFKLLLTVLIGLGLDLLFLVLALLHLCVQGIFDSLDVHLEKLYALQVSLF